MSLYIHKSHNVSVLIYHLVCVVKLRQPIFDKEVDKQIKSICLDIANRYEIHFLEIGADSDHMHFLIQSIPMYQPTKIARIVKSITARKVLERLPEVREELWGAQFWTDGYFINTVGRNNTETAVKQYIQQQGSKPIDYYIIHKDQLKLL